MSKGSSYWSTATGKIGNTVVRIVRGQRIESAYQPNITDAKTSKQCLARAKFSCALSLYKTGISQFFKFAYEDKKQTESDYNAFARHNISRAGYMTKEQSAGTFPSIGLNYLISVGSLGTVELVNGNNACYYLPLASLSSGGKTVGDLSKCLITDYNLQSGDIVTVLRISSTVTSLTQNNPAQNPIWSVKQIKVSLDDTTTLSDISSEWSLVAGSGLYIDNMDHSSCYWYGVIFSRVNSSGLKVSTSSLVGNSLATTLYYKSLASDWQQKVLDSFDATQEAILEGTRLAVSAAGSILTVAGDNVPRISETVMSAGVSSSAVLTGTGLTNINASDFSGVGVQVTSYIASSDTLAEITLTGTGEHPNSWYLTYGGKVIAQHSAVTPQIEKVSPEVIDVLDSGDTATVTITGNYVDALKVSDLVSSDTNLEISDVVAVNATTAYLTLKANANVTEATISYNGSVILTIKETPTEITSSATEVTTFGTITVQLTGTGLQSLTSNSFTKPSDWIISDYSASNGGTSATLTVIAQSYGNLYYGSTLIVNVYKAGSMDE